MNLEGAKILVTGGAGFIGSTTIDLILKKHSPEKIVILDNLIRGTMENIAGILNDRRVSLIEGDIRDLETVRKTIQGIDLVIHMATLRITACADEPRTALEIMCDGSFNVLDESVKAGVKKFITASTASIYGMADVFPTSESHHPYNNNTWYGATKIMLEGLLRSYKNMFGLDYIAHRYFNVYGPRMDIHGKYTEVLIRWMERIEAKQPPLIFGDGKQTMDFVFVEDVARANVLAALSDVTDEVFNVASGTETSLAELAETLCRVMKSDLKPEYGPERKVNPVQRRLADTRKAERMLDFKSEIDLEEGLKRLVNWWRSRR